MASLVSETVTRVLRKYQSQDTPDLLTSAMTVSSTTLNYQGFLPAWGPGTVAQVGEERMLVIANDASGKAATVVRGWEGTTASSHSVGDVVTVGPRGERDEVLSLINDCLDDMFPELYKVGVTEIDYSGTTIGYEIPDEAYKILKVSARMESSSSLWEPIFDWDIETQAASEFSTGRAIMLRVSLPSGSKFRVMYGTRFTPVTSESQDLEVDAGMAEYMIDLPYYYALSRLLAGEEQLRSQIRAAQTHQRAQDVPGFLALRTGEWYAARYRERKLNAMKVQSQVDQPTVGTGYGT